MSMLKPRKDLRTTGRTAAIAVFGGVSLLFNLAMAPGASAANCSLSAGSCTGTLSVEAIGPTTCDGNDACDESNCDYTDETLCSKARVTYSGLNSYVACGSTRYVAVCQIWRGPGGDGPTLAPNEGSSFCQVVQVSISWPGGSGSLDLSAFCSDTWSSSDPDYGPGWYGYQVTANDVTSGCSCPNACAAGCTSNCDQLANEAEWCLNLTSP